MGTGYSRNDTSNNIADGNIINAADLDGEFDAIQSAFNASTGHTHDGTTAEGAPITVTGPAQDYVSSATEFRPKTNNTYDLGSLSLQWKDLYVDGTGYIDSVDIDGGAIDGTTIGGSSAAAGSFTTLGASGNATVGGTLGVTGLSTLASVDINGGNIDGTTIGSASAAAGTFTTATATTGNITTVNATTVDSTNVEVTNIKAKDGTASATVADSTGVMTIASSVLTTTDINGGTIDGVTIGGSSAGAITGTTITGSSFVTTGDMTFGDNDKAIFGAGSNLQIYNDGTHNYIEDTTTGNLYIQGTNLILKSQGGTENLADFVTNGAVTLYYDNATKLATTSTGVDVTGTVTADGLTVDGGANLLTRTSSGAEVDVLEVRNNATAASTASAIKFVNSTAAGSNSGSTELVGVRTGTNTGDFKIRTSNSSASMTDRMLIGSNGDISFYEDTGTTPKFFWDASAERLGLGTTSPDVNLDIEGISSPQIRVTDTGGSVTTKLMADTVRGYVGTQTNVNFSILTNNTVRATFDTSGNVGIGTSSPLSVANYTALTVQNNTYGGIVQVKDDTVDLRLQIQPDTAGRVGTHSNHPLRFDTNGTEAMRIDSSGNVGIGISSPASYDWSNTIDLVVGNTSGASGLSIVSSTTGGGNIAFADGTTGDERYRGYIYYDHTSDYMSLWTAAAERMRIDASGNLLVGKTSADVTTAGARIFPTGDAAFVTNGSAPIIANRLTSDGDIISFRKDGTTVGSIGTASDTSFVIASNNTGVGFGSTSVSPTNGSLAFVDNQKDLGSASFRWDDVYATNGTIQTSDANEKQDIAELSDAEQRVAVAAKGLLRKFRWKDAVAEKGDDARIHFGIIAQDLQAAFEAEGLDAGRYAMFIHSTWTDEETGEERSRMGVRYSELLAFIIAAI